jgi:hypothetical protein
MARAGVLNIPSVRTSTFTTSRSISLIDAEPSVSGVEFPEQARRATVKHGRELSLFLERSITPETPRGRRQGSRAIARAMVARLVTTNPRPKEKQRAMVPVIHDARCAAIEAAAPSYW